MSTKIKLGLLMAVVLAGLLFVVAFARGGPEKAADDFHFDAAKLTDSTVWTQVNKDPYHVNAVVSAACAAVTVTDDAAKKRNPHAGSFITVYVNNLARGPIFARELSQFPEGSIIVKAKSDFQTESRKPVLYTIMRKREQGYNPKVGDWEFSVVGPNGTDVQAIGKLENCQACHLSVSDSDFVFRPYVKWN